MPVLLLCVSSTGNALNKMKNNILLVVSSRVVSQNSIVDWPDLNKPGTISTYLRIVHKIDYDNLRVQLDSADGPWLELKDLPKGVGFYELCI